MQKLRWSALLSLAGLGLLSIGCVMLDGGQQIAHETVRTFKPKSSDYHDPTEEDGDEWAFVGKDARGHQARERDPDPWWQRWLMTEKARSIESNLGIAGPDE